jgi:2-keto-4-pentenoate hydratase/2-oxohepta-3-ene-1,7-dioic acid hydratase in catechol pathway
MRLACATTPDGPRPAVVCDGEAHALERRPRPGGLRDLAGQHRATLSFQAGEQLNWPLGAPLRPGKIVGVGLNYRDHAAEVGEPVPAAPMLFTKPPSSVIGPGEPIVVDPAVTAFADWEVELAVIVGRPLLRATPAEARAAIFGYTVANDVTARDIQQAEGQWTRAKSLHTFCPLGPVVVTPDELGDPGDLALRTRLNGELVQDSSTRAMAVGVYDLLAFCSHSFLLEPGDVLLTGTPPGVGISMTPPRSLRHGDVVECEIERIGRLRNPVVVLGAEHS